MSRIIDNKFDVGDFVYLKTDVDQDILVVYGIFVSQYNILYRCICGTRVSDHYDFELTYEKDTKVI